MFFGKFRKQVQSLAQGLFRLDRMTKVRLDPPDQRVGPRRQAPRRGIVAFRVGDALTGLQRCLKELFADAFRLGKTC